MRVSLVRKHFSAGPSRDVTRPPSHLAPGSAVSFQPPSSFSSGPLYTSYSPWASLCVSSRTDTSGGKHSARTLYWIGDWSWALQRLPVVASRFVLHCTPTPDSDSYEQNAKQFSSPWERGPIWGCPSSTGSFSFMRLAEPPCLPTCVRGGIPGSAHRSAGTFISLCGTC